MTCCKNNRILTIAIPRLKIKPAAMVLFLQFITTIFVYLSTGRRLKYFDDEIEEK